MKAVLRLVLVYFTGTPFLGGITALGVLVVAGGCAVLLYLPPLVAQIGGQSPFSFAPLAEEAAIMLLPAAGILCIAFGASLLPALFARLATGHSPCVLPRGRAKLLASAFATIALVALVAAGAVTVYYVHTPLPLHVAFTRAFIGSLLTYSLLYVVLWLAGRARSAIGLLVGAIVVIVTLVLPLRFIAAPSRSYLGAWIGLAALWGAFAAGFGLAPRFGPVVRRLWHAVTARVTGAAYRGGGEVDLLIGTARPWLLALGQIVPVLIGTYFLAGLRRGDGPPPTLSPWLFFLAILSILSGAASSLAATRSRGLWLRAGWTRAELFRRVEAAFWRHNGYALAVLLAMLAGLDIYYGLPPRMLGFGLGLLTLGTVLSTYLGLMVTAKISWIDAALAKATMLALMAVALYATAPSAPAWAIAGLEAMLAALALPFRHRAQRRWRDLDWMQCRRELAARAPA